MIPGILKRVAVNQQVPYPYLSMKHDYIETSVCSNDGNMAEYRIVSTNKRMSCYIPSKAGEVQIGFIIVSLSMADECCFKTEVLDRLHELLEP